MKTLILSILILICVIPAQAQLVKKKTKTVGEYKETFYINRSTKMRHGFYTKIHKETGTKAVSGEFVKGMRYGKWTFKDAQSGNVILEYDFSKNQLCYLDIEQFPDSFIVKTNNSYQFTEVERPAIFIGYLNEEVHILEKNLIIPKDVKKEGLRGQCTIAFFVDKQGYISESKVISSMGHNFENQIHNKVLTFYDRFLPAIKDGETVESVFYVKVNVLQKDDLIPEEPIKEPYINDVFLTYYLREADPRVFLFPTVYLPFGRNLY